MTSPFSEYVTSKENENNTNLKVPPLKIICANPNGGLPYVKTGSEEKSSSVSPPNTISKPLKKEESLLNDNLLKYQEDSSSSNDVSQPVEPLLTRNKSSKNLRVSSPIATIPAKTLPTRRSTAAASSNASNISISSSLIITGNNNNSQSQVRN